MRASLVHAEHRSAVYSVIDRGGSLLTGGGDGVVLGCSIGDVHVRMLAQVPGAIYAMSERDDLLAIGTKDGELFLLDLEKKDTLQRVEA
ncbi:MAG TPA: hypothetical protein PK760_12090, partial [Flavobacteriales bacterium]|nr:hypothetical protein [Flavobacteriales bacterium]